MLIVSAIVAVVIYCGLFASTGETQQELLARLGLLPHGTLPLQALRPLRAVGGTPHCFNIYLLLTKGAGFLYQ